MRTLMMAGAILAASTAVNAQNPDEIARRQAVERQAAVGVRVPLEQTVKGAPYSAEFIVDSRQTLADGNRITRHTTGRVYRDGEGRTRREEDRADGTVAISIVDPVAGVAYRLEPENRIAWKSPAAASVAILRKLEEARTKERRKIETEQSAAAGGAPPIGVARGRSAGAPPPTAPVETRGFAVEGRGAVMPTAPLEHRVLEGLAVEGRKVTTTIPAGQIGNEQPITIVSEEWSSPELKVLVLTHHDDPRMGESSYRLTNIVRAEADGSLFQVPPGYAVKESGIRREPNRER